MRGILKTNAAMNLQQRRPMAKEESRTKVSRLNCSHAAHVPCADEAGDFSIRKRRRSASFFLCFIFLRLRMLLGFRSLIANNDELRRIKEEFFQKGRFICREPMPGLMRMHAARLLCGCAHACSFSPGCARTFPLMRHPSRHYAFHLRNRLFFNTYYSCIISDHDTATLVSRETVLFNGQRSCGVLDAP